MKIDCRSLIKVRTNAKELLPEPLYGWVSMYSSSTSDMILSKIGVKNLSESKKVLKKRGGFVEPSILKAAAAAAAAKSSSEAPKPDTAKQQPEQDTDKDTDKDKKQQQQQPKQPKQLQEQNKNKQNKQGRNNQQEKQQPEQKKSKQKDQPKQEPQKKQSGPKPQQEPQKKQSKPKPAAKPAPSAKPKLRRGLPRLADLRINEAEDGTYKLTIFVKSPKATQGKAQGNADKRKTTPVERGSGKAKAQKVPKPTSDKEADAVAERSQGRKALAGLKEGANERKAEKFKAKKALAGLKEGKNESKAETHQKKKAMSALKTPRKTKTGDVDPAIRAFLEDAVQEICKTQPENPLRVLAQMCRDKAAAPDPAPSLQEAAEPEPEPEGPPVTTVEEAVRQLKKYHDLGALGVKKLVQQVIL